MDLRMSTTVHLCPNVGLGHVEPKIINPLKKLNLMLYVSLIGHGPMAAYVYADPLIRGTLVCTAELTKDVVV